MNSIKIIPTLHMQQDSLAKFWPQVLASIFFILSSTFVFPISLKYVILHSKFIFITSTNHLGLDWQ